MIISVFFFSILSLQQPTAASNPDHVLSDDSQSHQNNGSKRIKHLITPNIIDGGGNKNTNSKNECGVYFAPSTIPGGGSGIFAGKDFVEGDTVTPGELIVPIQDFSYHNKKHKSKKHFLWDHYVWQGSSYDGVEEEAADVNAATFGIGAAINCNFALINIEYNENKVERGISSNPLEAPMGSSPGAGAATILRDLQGKAISNISAGMELFLDYGEGYFDLEEYENVVKLKHLRKGKRLLHSFQVLRYRLQSTRIHSFQNLKASGFASSNENAKTLQDSLMDDVYDMIAHSFQGIWGSTVLKTLPDDLDRVADVLREGIELAHVEKSIRSVEWLKEHGTCADLLEEGISTIPHVERGAFARRAIAKEETIAPVPLIHIHDRRLLNMRKPPYGLMNEVIQQSSKDFNSNGTVFHQQLLLNYCFGHSETKILLCPYGIGTGLINHSKEHANARITWSKKHMSHPEWLDQKPSEWAHNAFSGLAWEFMATRDILEGEEVLIDYGDDWEEAWSQHVARWKSPKRKCIPASAYDLNENKADMNIPTVYEGHRSLSLLNKDFCDTSNTAANVFPTVECQFEVLKWLESSFLDEVDGEQFTYPCRVVGRHRNEKHGPNSYTVEVYDRYDEEEDGFYVYNDEDYYYSNQNYYVCQEVRVGVLFGVPGDILKFTDRPYTRDSAQPWSFRHAMGIPNDLLPSAWRRTKTTKAAASATNNTIGNISDPDHNQGAEETICGTMDVDSPKTGFCSQSFV